MEYIYKSRFDYSDFTESPNSNIVVAVLDTGIDPGTPGLLKLPDGSPKIIDIIDCSGSGDINTTKIGKLLDDNYIVSDSGNIRHLPNEFSTFGQINIGSTLLDKLICSKIKKLEKLIKNIVVDVFTFKGENKLFYSYLFINIGDGNFWQGYVEDYNINKKFYYLKLGDSIINFGAKIYSEQLMSLVFESGYHGTHVAGIIGAYFGENNSKNGLNPYVSLISLKISDSRVGGLETSESLIRALNEIVDRKIHLVNMSFGEPITEPKCGLFIKILEEYCKKYNIIFVTSAGNSGPGLMTIGAPAASTSLVISVGAFTDNNMMKHMYYKNDNGFKEGVYSWSSRGPCVDGAEGVTIIAPGGAISTVSSWCPTELNLLNGTSMASPYVCGCISLLLNKLNYIPYFYWVDKCLQMSSFKLKYQDEYAIGSGLIDIKECYNLFKNNKYLEKYKYGYDISCKIGGKNGEKYRGVFLWGFENFISICVEIFINPFFENEEDVDNRSFEKILKISYSDNLKYILTIPESIYISRTGNTLVAKLLVNFTRLLKGTIYLWDNNILCGSIPINILSPTVNEKQFIENKYVKHIDLLPGIPVRMYFKSISDLFKFKVIKGLENPKSNLDICITQICPKKSIEKTITSYNKNIPIFLDVQSSTLIELCICQKNASPEKNYLSFYTKFYNKPCMLSNPLNISSHFSSYIDTKTISRLDLSNNIDTITSILSPNNFNIEKYDGNIFKNDKKEKDKDENIYNILTLTYIIPNKVSGKVKVGVSDDYYVDIYESELYRSMFMTFYCLGVPVKYGNNRLVDIDFDKDDIDKIVISTIGPKKVLEDMKNTSIYFKKNMNLSIKTFKSKKDMVLRQNEIKSIKKVDSGIYYFSVDIDSHVKLISEFHNYIFTGEIFRSPISIYKVTNKNKSKINKEKKSNDFVNKIDEIIKKVNPSNIDTFTNYELNEIIENIYNNGLLNEDQKVYPKIKFLEYLKNKENYDKSIFEKYNLKDINPYWMVYYQDKEDNNNNKYIENLKKYYKEFENFTKKDYIKCLLQRLKINEKNNLREIEYYNYMLNKL